MPIVSTSPRASLRRRKTTPTLAPGDRLSRGEFERRYDAMPPGVKAELIEGVVYMPTPVNFEQHGEPHSYLMTWLGAYLAATPGVRIGDNTTVRLDLDNEPQPDALLMVDPDRGGQARIDSDGFIVGPPELIAEVTASSVSYDLHDKLHAYRRNGVKEYVVWRVLDEAIDWFILRGGEYEPLTPGASEAYESETFPGLWLDAAALLRGDLTAVLARLQEGIASPAHAEFVKRLARE